MDSRVGHAQFTGDMCNRFSSGLGEPHHLTFTLLRRALLNFLHDPCPPVGGIYPKLSLHHEAGAISPPFLLGTSLMNEA
jgi:hypothetical protein